MHDAVNKIDFTKDQRIKYFASATHLEIIKGALNPPENTENPAEHVFAFIRHIEGMPINATAKDYIEWESGEIDSENVDPESLMKLKDELNDKLGKDHCKKYTSGWQDNKTLMHDPEDFATQVYELLSGIISNQIENSEIKNEIEQEKKLHEEFKKLLVTHFRGRTETLEKIKDYIDNAANKNVLSLIGDSGSGKSSVMAEAIKRLEEPIENKEIKWKEASIVYRFIGVTSASTNIVSLLRSITGEIAEHYGETRESVAGKDQEKSLYEIQGLSEVLRKCFGLATGEKPIVLFLDALNQLSDTDNAKTLYWLPKELPENVKIVVSSLPELKENLNDTLQEMLPLLPEQEAREILKKWLEAIDRTLTEKQFNEVIESFNKTKLAIYLKIAFEMARHWHSYKKDYLIKDDVKGLINEYFDFLENEEHNKEFVRTVLSYMLCGKYQGLTENEILEILVFDEKFWKDVFLGDKVKKGICHPQHRNELIKLKDYLEKGKKGSKVMMKIPIVLWSRLFLDLEPFLTEKDADGVPIITFFHQQFFEVLRERYELK